MSELRETSLVEAIDTRPVLATGKRWLCGREDRPQAVAAYFDMFPECRNDPRRAASAR